MSHSNGNGAVHHNEAIVDKSVAAGLIQDTDRGDHVAVEKALDELLAKFTQLPPGRLVPNSVNGPRKQLVIWY